MSILPAWSLAEALETKQDAQLAVFGQTFDYIPHAGANFPLTACKDEGAREGDKHYFRLHARPEEFQRRHIQPKAGDRILTGDLVWYVLVEHALEDGWQVLLFRAEGVGLMARLRVYVKKQLVVNSLAFRPQQMYKIGHAGTLDVKMRVGAAVNANDAPAKKLTKRYAIYKNKVVRMGRVKRDLTLTGAMLQNFQVRTVSNNSAQARNSTRKDREKANRNQQREPWILFSPNNQRAVLRVTQQVFGDIVKQMVRGRMLAFPMVEPLDLQLALVRKLRSIAPLVAEMNGDPERIQPYVDIYPQNVSIGSALYKIAAPMVLAAWQGITPGPFGGVTLWKQQLTLWVRAGGDVAAPERSLGRIAQAIYAGEVAGTGHALIHQNSDSWVPGAYFDAMELFPFSRQQNEEGIDIWEVPILIQQIK